MRERRGDRERERKQLRQKAINTDISIYTYIDR